MKKVVIFITIISISLPSLATPISKNKSIDSITVLFKLTPTNLINPSLPVIQFGNEFKYKNSGLSSEYGYPIGNRSGLSEQKEHYFTFRTEFRKYFTHIDNYLAFEYFYIEHYNVYKDYNYWTDHGHGEYYYTNVEYISVGEKKRGFNLKYGKTQIYRLFLVDFYFGIGLHKTKTRVLYRSTPNEDHNNMHRGIFKPNTGYQNGENFRPQITLGIKLAVPLYTSKTKNPTP